MKFVVKDLTGNRFGRLTVISLSHIDKHAYWKCLCDCGNEKTTNSGYLMNGSVMSCGCLKKEKSKLNGFQNKHGKSRTYLYHRYYTIKSRCNNPNDKKYKLYGERGIKMCYEWDNNFLAFEKWATENKCTRELTIDRIDGEKGYSPENCRIVGYVKQNNNRCICNYLTINGEIKTVSEWAEYFGISKTLARLRYWKGIRSDSLFLPPHRGVKPK